MGHLSELRQIDSGHRVRAIQHPDNSTETAVMLRELCNLVAAQQRAPVPSEDSFKLATLYGPNGLVAKLEARMEEQYEDAEDKIEARHKENQVHKRGGFERHRHPEGVGAMGGRSLQRRGHHAGHI